MRDIKMQLWSKIICLNKFYKFSSTDFLLKCIFIVLIIENSNQKQKCYFVTKIFEIYRKKS